MRDWWMTMGLVSGVVWLIVTMASLSEWGDARRHREWVPEGPRQRAKWALVSLFFGWAFVPVGLAVLVLLIGGFLLGAAVLVVVILVGGLLSLPYKLWKDAFGRPPGPPDTALDDEPAAPSVRPSERP